ncbi:GGDEF domain-containing phosphodiesterase [Achromobacter ruhlandii]|uniref:GGDEF domain-containing phosphodiesterase n=1 Tax=Achromobacter sp. HNDS-1 TaxID=3151598 RepID=A0AAU7L805_9BURK|nr:GGDEF domain-containing phosphodiesterase [Achromobacter ruhlandii]AOU94553.1 diguanylate cyclase/phosphodiesterase [Achromobacter ruhlandii]MCV6795989.1 GGDEF domain-containing phosphodiesterase [Achromobacter ruhlandii]MCV6804270.1 GGDEF domain-containing phosphodiesterase [Achromobacter ruhlandii]MCV6808419.1 GGDEF domain-containing phosphodiesterase [Achromobacter ruhlandii]MCV6821374.1 GGDEF domain-containing phosphodiesterase [Achromobacter ruhlandii]
MFFVRRERVLRGRLTRDELTGVLSQRELQRRARAWLNQAERQSGRGVFGPRGPAPEDRESLGIARTRPGTRGIGAFFLVSFDQYAEISAMLRAGEDQTLLVMVADRLSLVTRALGGMVARTGTDAFTVCIPDVDEQGAAQVSAKLLEDLSVPYELGGRPLIAVFRVGAALYPDHGRSVEELQRCVQVAMVPLKERGGPGWNMFDFRMLARQRDQQGLENDLRLALTTASMDQFELYYQPVCDSGTGVVQGCEALLRWHHPELGSVSPAVTIELAERSGLIVPLGAWILERACSQAALWPPAWRVHVNLSVKQMNEDGLVQLVSDVLATTKLAPRKLVLEITESLFILHYERHVKILNTLRAKGIGVALDDFGCGYSSLNHLRHLPIDWVKIDRSFISALESDAGSREVVSALFGLCQAMHLPVVAEGVETEGQREILKSLGCRVMQGFLLGRPAPAAEIQALASAVS